MVTCTRCTNLPGKEGQAKEFTRLGIYRCSRMPKWTFISPFKPRECSKFTPVAPADLPARIQFEEAQGAA
jgi:hypothetical protein